MPKRKAVSTKARKSCPAVRCNFRSSPTCIEAKDKNRAVVQHCITVLASNQSSRGDIADHHKVLKQCDSCGEHWVGNARSFATHYSACNSKVLNNRETRLLGAVEDPITSVREETIDYPDSVFLPNEEDLTNSTITKNAVAGMERSMQDDFTPNQNSNARNSRFYVTSKGMIQERENSSFENNAQDSSTNIHHKSTDGLSDSSNASSSHDRDASSDSNSLSLSSGINSAENDMGEDEEEDDYRQDEFAEKDFDYDFDELTLTDKVAVDNNGDEIMSASEESDEGSSVDEELEYDEEDHEVPDHIYCEASHLNVLCAPNCSPDRKIQEYCKTIREHKRLKGIHPAFYLPYVGLLKKMTKPGTPDSLYNEVAADISKFFSPTVSTNIERSNYCDFPSRTTLKSWVESMVHPPEYVSAGLSRPTKTKLTLPSGQTVFVTTNNLAYQLALIFTDDTLMQPENFLFPNKDDPFQLPDYDNIKLGDINTGTFHEQSSKKLCKPGSGRLLLPFVSFIDGTLVARNSVEPISLCPGIFKRQIRNLSRSWFIAGYIEPATNFSGKSNAYKVNSTSMNKEASRIKLNDYHAIISCIMGDFVKLQSNGFVLDLPTLTKGEIRATMVPVMQVVISDCKGADYLTGRFGSHSAKVKGLVRDCDVETVNAADHNHVCKYFVKKCMDGKSVNELKDVSFHHIDNAFDKIYFGWGQKFGIYGSTPPETLHMFYLGICEYLYDGFYCKLNLKMRKLLDEVSKEMVFKISRQGHGDLPSVSTFRNGIKFRRLMITGKEKLSRVFLLYLCLQNTAFVEQLKDSSKRRSKTSAPYEFNIAKIRAWYKIIEWTLSLDCWLRNEEHDKGYFKPMTNENESQAQNRIREYMKLFKSTVKRTKGTGMLLTKFHHLLHMEHYCRIHGSMANFDGSRPESIGKTMTKDPGSRTQHQPTKLTYQCAEKLPDIRNIQYFGTQLYHNHFDLYTNFDINDSLAHLIPPDLSQNVPDFRPHNGEQTISLSPTGSRFDIYYEANALSASTNLDFDAGLKIKWTTKTKYSLLWHSQLLARLENRLFLGPHKNRNIVFEGFTELKIRVIGNDDTHRFRAHPSYRGGRGWNSWAMVAWKNEDTRENDDDCEVQMNYYPARILMFYKVKPNQQRPRLASVDFQPGEIYAVIQSAYKEQKQSSGCSLVGTLNTRYDMEMSVSIIDATAISSPVSVVEDKWCSITGEEWLVETASAIMDPFLWSDHFYDERNRI